MRDAPLLGRVVHIYTRRIRSTVADRLPMLVEDQTEVGSYFVATYPPFSVWTRGGGRARRACRRSHAPPVRRRAARAVPAHPVLPEAVPLLLLPRLHRQERAGGRRLPRRRWRASGSCTRQLPAIAGRPLNFVYFGGGTPSFLSTQQLEGLVVAADRGRRPWSDAEEITFECEPGTLTEAKLAVDPRHRRHAPQPRRRELRRRDPRAERPRASLAGDRSAPTSSRASLDFPQINIDLIAGMLGETDENWRACVEKTLELEPTASPSTRWSCRSTRRSAATC